jgi:hypothetical protein
LEYHFKALFETPCIHVFVYLSGRLVYLFVLTEQLLIEQQTNTSTKHIPEEERHDNLNKLERNNIEAYCIKM